MLRHLLGEGEAVTKTMARHARFETTLKHLTDTERFDLHGAIRAHPLPMSPDDLPGAPWPLLCQSDASERTSCRMTSPTMTNRTTQAEARKSPSRRTLHIVAVRRRWRE